MKTTITLDSPIADLELPDHAIAALSVAKIDTLGEITELTYTAVAALRGMRPDALAAIAAAVESAGLAFADPRGIARVCTTCPTCPDCGNPRAQSARDVTTDVAGRASHIGFRQAPACDDCHRDHAALVATTNARLLGAAA